MRSLFPAAMLAAAVALSPFAASAAPAAATAKAAEKTVKAPSAGQQAMRERQKACGAEWKTVKGTKAAEGKKWPQFWSECNKRLKEQ